MRSCSTPSTDAKKLSTSATTATPVTEAASAIHLSCWRSYPVERRSRTTRAAAANATDAPMNIQPNPTGGVREVEGAGDAQWV